MSRRGLQSVRAFWKVLVKEFLRWLRLRELALEDLVGSYRLG